MRISGSFIMYKIARLQLFLMLLLASRWQLSLSAQELTSGLDIPLSVGNSVPLGAAVSDGKEFAVAASAVELFTAAGKRLWIKPLKLYQPRGLLITANSIIVAEDGVYALSLANGEYLWTSGLQGNYSFTTPLRDGDTLIVGDDQHRIFALDLHTGSELWRYDLDPHAETREVITGLVEDGTDLYITVTVPRVSGAAGSSGYIVALDRTNRKEHWRYESRAEGHHVGFTAPPLVLGKKVVAPDDLGNRLVALDRETGRVIWTFLGERNTAGVSGTPLFLNRVLFLGSGDRFIYALDPDTGRTIWRRDTGSSVVGLGNCGNSLIVINGKVSAYSLDGDIESVDRIGLFSELTLSQIGYWSGGVTLSDTHTLHVIRCIE